MKRNISIIASLAIFSVTSVFAESNSIEEAFKNGKTSGDISVHYETWDNGSNKDYGFSTPSIGLKFETDTFNGFSAGVAFRGNTETSEENNGDYEETMAENGNVTEAYIQYENDIFAVKAGRQEMDLEWLSDYNDGVIAILKAIPYTTLTAGYTNRQAEITLDTHDKFHRFENKKGDDSAGFVIDGKIEPIKGLVFNPYFYTADDIADYYGLKTTFDNDLFGLTAHYAQTNEDNPKGLNDKDGDILNLEARLNVNDFNFMIGYIKTDSDGGIGSLDSLGDNIDQTEELTDAVYGIDAKTYYLKAAYTYKDLELSALYTHSKHDVSTKDVKDKELTLAASYNITKQLSAELIYTDANIDKNSDLNDGEDFNKFVANLTYSF
ncbi:hypothetical protein CPU12_12990 [Malaciobacter molluscorum LMG 25693]|uniref:Porin domain-containing protein n=1 Tax=Malaciobacter molluscorum LMG 25693 TaxID=870501 RepID=A0A2G1DEP2_9BACT|nr:Opr family porin [Malaciobacter molluscorum]AXX93075.1 hypothetical protein AMOL_2122 [Malaciobacter molluscorum LMG 25693]PHO16957.1 hypothetical protein CPU12_12990 [Malaciobacter molluscorum LMG 25693]